MNVAVIKGTLTLDDRDFQRGLQASDARLKGFTTGLDRADKSVKKFGTTLKSVGDSLRSVGTTMTIGVTLPMAGLARQAIQTSINLDSLKRGLGAVTKEAGPLGTQLERLRALGKDPGLSFQSAIQGSTRLQAASLSAKQAEKTMKELANAITVVGGSTEDFNRVALALSQVQSAGKLMGDELRQLQEPLPQIRAALIEAFGTANTEILAQAEITSDEFIQVFTDALSKGARATAGPKVEFEKGMQEIGLALGELGDIIVPIAAKFLKDFVPAFKTTVEWIDKLPDPIKAVGVALVATFGATGPAMVALGSAIITWTQLNRLVEINTGLVAANATVSAAAAGGQAAVAGAAAARQGVSTGVGAISTTAATGMAVAGAAGAAKGMAAKQAINMAKPVQGGNWGAAATALSLKDAYKQAILRGASPATKAALFNRWKAAEAAEAAANVTTAAVNTTAASTAAKGGRFAALRGFGGKALGLAGRGLGKIALPLTIATTAFEAASWLNDIQDERRGVQKVGMGDTLNALNPFHDPNKAVDAEMKQRMAEFRRMRAEGKSPGQIARAEAAATAAQTADSPEGKDPNKLAVNRAPFKKKAREAFLEARQAEAEAAASVAPSEQNAREMAKRVIPILRERMTELLSQEKVLEGEAKDNAVKQAELYEVRKDRFRLQENIGNLERQAADELKQEQDKQKAEAKRQKAEAERQYQDRLRANDLAFDASVSMARANLGPEREGRVQREAQTVIPMLLNRAKELEARAAQLAPMIQGNAELTEQYYEWMNEAAEKRQEAANIESRALGEQQEIIKRQEREAKKRFEDQKRNFEDWQDAFNIRGKLAKEQLENDPFLSKQQRGEMLIPYLRQAYAALSYDAPGETPKEAMQRLLQREQVKGDIMEALGAKGKGATTKVLGGGIMPFGFDPRRVGSEMQLLEQMGRSAEASQYGNTMGQKYETDLHIHADPFTAYGAVQAVNTPEFRTAFERFFHEFMTNQAKAASQRRVQF